MNSSSTSWIEASDAWFQCVRDNGNPPMEWLTHISTVAGRDAVVAETLELWEHRFRHKLKEAIDKTPTDNVQSEYVEKFKASGTAAIQNAYDDIGHDTEIMRAARPATVAGVSMNALDVAARQKRALTPEAVGHLQLSEKAPKRIKKVTLMCTPAKPSLVKQPIGKAKHSLVADVVPIFRSTRLSVPVGFERYVEIMQEEGKRGYCQASVTNLIKRLSETPMPDHSAALILGESMTRTFEDVEEEKAFHVARTILMDIFHMVRYAPLATLPLHAAERKFLIEHIAPALKAIEHTYAVLTFKWVDVQSQATKELNILQNPGASNASTCNVDIIGVIGADETELAFVEQSGGPGVFARLHTSDDCVKVTNESINGCKARLREFLDAPAQSVTKLASLGLQIISEERLKKIDLS
ncbi:hypothetical protein HDU90_000864 [Geranomyces variabilis]|nr:hypothetical protein HDU90_000864 [Geranomyces variabilis]